VRTYHAGKPPKQRTVDSARFQCEHFVLIDAFVDIRPALVRDTYELVTLGYGDSGLELDLTKRMVHRIAKEAFKEGASNSFLASAALEVEPKLEELLENET